MVRINVYNFFLVEGIWGARLEEPPSLQPRTLLLLHYSPRNRINQPLVETCLICDLLRESWLVTVTAF